MPTGATITYNAALAACERAGEWETALQLLLRMSGDGVPRDADTYGIAISACARAGGRGAYARATELYARMSALDRLRPSSIATNALIGAQARGGTPAARASSLGTFRQMCVAACEGKGPVPDSVTLNQVLDACWRARRDPPFRPFCVAACPSAALPTPAGGLGLEAALPPWLAHPRDDGARVKPLQALDSIFGKALENGVYLADEFHAARARAQPHALLSGRGVETATEQPQPEAVLDLHCFSPGAAVAAVRWWRRQLALGSEAALPSGGGGADAKEKQIAKLTKEATKLAPLIAKLKSKLEDPAYLSKVPEATQAKDREKLDQYTKMHDDATDAIAKLG
jgi:pentatricopeptide repeat protein